MQKKQSLVYFLILSLLIVLVMADKMRPMRVFVVYYSCKIVEQLGLTQTCNQLPVVAVLENGKPDADLYGIEDPLALTLFFERYKLPGHVYAHRTNSPERAKLYANYYQAFEFDAVWDEVLGKLDIYHYPEHNSMQFYFDNLLTIVPKTSRLWLDLKNLTANNKQHVVDYLDQLFPEVEQRQRLIVESKNPLDLELLKQSGYKTSYYLPSANKLHGCEEDSSVKAVINNINQISSDYISFPYSQQEFVDRCVLPLARNIEQLSWGGLPFAIPNGALSRYQGYIVDHSVKLNVLE